MTGKRCDYWWGEWHCTLEQGHEQKHALEFVDCGD